MPRLKQLAEDPAAREALVQWLSDPAPMREEVRLNHGFKSFAELRAHVCQPPFEDGEDDVAEVVASIKKAE